MVFIVVVSATHFVLFGSVPVLLAGFHLKKGLYFRAEKAKNQVAFAVPIHIKMSGVARFVMIYQLVVQLVTPYCMCLIATCVAVGVVCRKGGVGKWLRGAVIGPLACLYLLSLPPVTHLLAWSLEGGYPARQSWPAETQAVVVLSAGCMSQPGDKRRYVPSPQTIMRCLHAEEVARHLGNKPIVVCGGKADEQRQAESDAQLMQAFLLKLGVSPQLIVMEQRSRTTHENASYAAKVLADQGWQRVVLVTDASHLTRSVLCFRSQGIEVIASPATHSIGPLPQNIALWLLPSLESIIVSHSAIHEWLGLAWYWLKGRL